MNGATIDLLLVEDNPQDLDLSLRALRLANLADRLHVARDGTEALEFLFCTGQHAARRLADGPKLILLDLKLPKLNGLELLKRIKGDRRTSAIPVVVLTASQEQRDVDACYALGVNSYVVKPMKFERFTAIVAALGNYWLTVNQSATMPATFAPAD